MAAPSTSIKPGEIPLSGIRVLVDGHLPGRLVGTIGRDHELHYDIHLDVGGGLFVEPARVTREPAGLQELRPHLDKAIAAELRRLADLCVTGFTKADVLQILRNRADDLDGGAR